MIREANTHDWQATGTLEGSGSANKAGTRQRRMNAPPGRPASRSHRQLKALLDLRRELLAELEHCRADLPGSGDRPSDVADKAIDKVSRTLAAATIEHLGHRIREVEAALERLEEGSYGICIDCGRRVSQARIRANPTARRCLKCQSSFEKSRGPGLSLYS